AGSRYLSDLVAHELGEPEVAVRPRSDRRRLASRRDPGRELGHVTRGRDPADLARRRLGEPEVSIRPLGDRRWLRAGVRGRVRERCGDPGAAPPGGYPAPLFPVLPGEPEFLFRFRRDPRRTRIRGEPSRDLADLPLSRYPPDPVARELGEPQVAVGPGG